MKLKDIDKHFRHQSLMVELVPHLEAISFCYVDDCVTMRRVIQDAFS